MAFRFRQVFYAGLGFVLAMFACTGLNRFLTPHSGLIAEFGAIFFVLGTGLGLIFGTVLDSILLNADSHDDRPPPEPAAERTESS